MFDGNYYGRSDLNRALYAALHARDEEDFEWKRYQAEEELKERNEEERDFN